MVKRSMESAIHIVELVVSPTHVVMSVNVESVTNTGEVPAHERPPRSQCSALLALRASLCKKCWLRLLLELSTVQCPVDIFIGKVALG